MYKLVILIHAISIGGAENMVYQLIKDIDSSLFNVEVVCTHEKMNNYLESKIEGCTNVHFLNITGRTGFRDIIKVCKYINSLNPDIVHTHLGGTAFGIAWACVFRKPLVITVHTKPEKAFEKRTNIFLRSGLAKKYITLVAVSGENLHLMKKFYKKRECSCFKINNGIQADRFYNEVHEGFTFINVGRQDENKNQRVIINAFSKIHKDYINTKLMLIGDGPCHEELLKEIEKHDLCDCVVCPGMVSEPEKYYAVSDCYIQSSHREAMPLTALEAMASRLPIISTDVGGMRDIVKENGFLIKDNDVNALYGAMLEMVQMGYEDLRHLGEKSFELIDDYTSIKMARRYCDLYICLINHDNGDLL